ncbi:MobF family relaxase [Streptomyces sp. NPDC087917]|uniref:MobF family relaxase n=1 Tax=Streptomyces sp. NPDC087917 TaxID=3155060 RepID=UPI00342104C5
MGRGLAMLGLTAGEEVTEQQLRSLFGERGRHPYEDRIEAEEPAAGKSPKQAVRAGALGRRVTVTGFDLTFRPQPTIYLLWTLGDEETRRVIEAAHEHAIERVLEWIEDESAIIRYGKDGIYMVRPPGGLVAARFRHYEARIRDAAPSRPCAAVGEGAAPGREVGVDHRQPRGYSEVVLENTVAASALYNEIVAAEVCEELGLATEPRVVIAGRRPVMDKQIAACLNRGHAARADPLDSEHEYVTAVDDEGELKYLPAVSERARVELMRMAAHKTRPPKQMKARSLARLRADWKQSAIDTSKVAADSIHSLLERARAAATAIRARVAAVVDVGLAAVDVAAVVFVMNGGGRFHRRHLLAGARRHLALVLRGRRRDPALDEQVVAAAISTYCLDISEPTTVRGLLSDYRLYTARWALSDLVSPRRSPTAVPDPDRLPPADPGAPAAAAPGPQGAGEWEIPRVPLSYDRAVLAGATVREKLRTTTTTVQGPAYDVVAHQQAASRRPGHDRGST